MQTIRIALFLIVTMALTPLLYSPAYAGRANASDQLFAEQTWLFSDNDSQPAPVDNYLLDSILERTAELSSQPSIFKVDPMTTINLVVIAEHNENLGSTQAPLPPPPFNESSVSEPSAFGHGAPPDHPAEPEPAIIEMPSFSSPPPP